MKKKFQIVVDSSADMDLNYFKNSDVLFNVAPLTIHINGKEYIDDANLDIKSMLKDMNDYNGQSTSACPPPGLFASFFEQAEYTICITMTSVLSGTYNSAMQGAELAKESGAKVHVVDSKVTNGVMLLIAEKCHELMTSGVEFETIIKEVDLFTSKKHFLFVLDKYDNLIKTGRMSKVSGIIAGFLKIKPITTGIDGEIKMIEKKRTSTLALKRLVDIIGERVSDFNTRDIIVSHCFDSETANMVKDLIVEKYNFLSVRVREMKGLCSFYSLEKGIIVSF